MERPEFESTNKNELNLTGMKTELAGKWTSDLILSFIRLKYVSHQESRRSRVRILLRFLGMT